MTFHISRSLVRTSIPSVLETLGDGRIHPEAGTTAVAPLDEGPAALQEHTRSEQVKAILVA